MTLSKPVDKTSLIKFARGTPSPTGSHLIASCIDPNELGILLASGSIPHTGNIPTSAFQQTVTFTDPATNLQFQIPNHHHFQAINQMTPISLHSTTSIPGLG